MALRRVGYCCDGVRFGPAACVIATTGPPQIADLPGGGWRFRAGPQAVYRAAKKRSALRPDMKPRLR
jgi:hypothetical protein